MTEPTIFLDFDGVLNSEKYQHTLRELGLPTSDCYGPLFDPEAIDNLRSILMAVPKARIIINSSWKLEGEARMRDLWRYRRLPGTLAGITPDYIPNLCEIELDNYDNIALLAGKGNEVRQWLEQHASGEKEGDRYVILDDMPDFLPCQEAHLVCTNPRTGLSLEDAVRAVKILRG